MSMDLTTASKLCTRAFTLAQTKLSQEATLLEDGPGVWEEDAAAKREEIKQLQNAHRILMGLFAVELRQRNVSRDLDPFSPNTHHLFEYRDAQGPEGERFSFVRRTDLVSTNPVGSRGWFHSEEECVAKMWEDHDELLAELAVQG